MIKSFFIAHQKCILVAVLDWGLGHASRSVPIIRAIQKAGHRAIIASDGRAAILLKEEFPSEQHIELPSYRIRYGTGSMIANMALQLPRITYAAFAEYFAIRRIVKEEKVDMIISDNRFGCFHPRVKSCFMTHQLNLEITNPIARFLGNAANRFWIKRYDECWVPDFQEKPNLSSSLSHPSPLKKVKYIGPLSRMKKMNIPKKYRLIIVLSGPEPQRTLLEEILLEQCKNIEGNILLVKGKTESKEQEQKGNIEIVSFMTSKELNTAICASEIIVSRSGYSTLMDLAALKKPAILIPTPGQTEQELLAKHFHEQGVFMMQKQENIDLVTALEQIHLFKGMQDFPECEFVFNFIK